MKLRKPQEKDWEKMLNWMHDLEVTKYLQTDFLKKTKEDCLDFIKMAQDESNGIHFSITDEKDEYLGTVSLKNVDLKNGNGEYAITLGKDAIGTGAAMFATIEILHYGFLEINLNKIYLCVSEKNVRGIKFYEKVPFTREGIFRQHLRRRESEYENLIWFSMLKSEFMERFLADIKRRNRLC